MGRQQDVISLSERLAGLGPPVILITGPGGCGKSELAREVAVYASKLKAFDGVRWLPVRATEYGGGREPRDTIEAKHARDIMLELAASLRRDVSALSEAFAAARWLVVIDNCDALTDEDQLFVKLGPLLGSSRVLATSRNQFTGTFVQTYPSSGGLRGLSAASAGLLIRQESKTRSGPHAMKLASISDAETQRIHHVTGGAPLALHLVVGAASRAPLDEVLADLEAGSPQSFYEYLFGRAWSDLSPEEREVLDYLAHAVIEPVPSELIRTSGVLPEQPRSALAELQSRSLVEVSEEADVLVYGLHPLTRSFVRARLRHGPPTYADRDRALRARSAGLAYLNESIEGTRRGQRSTSPLGGLGNYLKWIADATSMGEAAKALRASINLSRYLWEHGHWDLYISCEELAEHAANQLQDSHPNGMHLIRGLTAIEVGYWFIENGQLVDADRKLRLGLDQLNAAGDFAGSSIALRYLGQLYLLKREFDAAERELMAALARVDQGRQHAGGADEAASKAQVELRQLGLWEHLVVGYRVYAGDWDPGEAEIRNLLGLVYLQTDWLDRAENELTRSIELYGESKTAWPGSAANPMLNLARCYALTGDSREQALLIEALELSRSAARRDLEADLLLALGKMYSRSGQNRLAQEHATAAHQLHEALGRRRDATEAAELVASLRSHATRT